MFGSFYSSEKVATSRNCTSPCRRYLRASSAPQRSVGLRQFGELILWKQESSISCLKKNLFWIDTSPSSNCINKQIQNIRNQATSREAHSSIPEEATGSLLQLFWVLFPFAL